MPLQTEQSAQTFAWTPQPAAAAIVRRYVEDLLSRLPEARALADRLLNEAAVRFGDMVQAILLRTSDVSVDELQRAGWTKEWGYPGWRTLDNELGLFPAIALGDDLPVGSLALHLKVDSVADFLEAHGLYPATAGESLPHPLTHDVWKRDGATLAVVTWNAKWTQKGHVTDLAILDSFRNRPRHFASDAEAYAATNILIESAVARVGPNHTCDLFFRAEREFWQGRNTAAQWQFARQQRLGIGWANHDHHTYRCLRVNFTKLIATWEKLGFVCRERFYAGAEAGWGAQVMEHRATGIVTFNDVDLTPDELQGDFAHEALSEPRTLGTVGLWCALHGDSFLQAGMHHLECQFDFNALKTQLESASGQPGKVMKPFTNFPYLRQAFTEGEHWPVRGERVDRLLASGLITAEQGEQFRANGAIGSHLENLERNDGFKGFNQTGVSQIIRQTDPRGAANVR